MFSKEDYVNYFLQIHRVELSMGERFGSVAEAVDDPQLKKFFSELQRQEKAHSRIVDGMLETFGYKEEKK